MTESRNYKVCVIKYGGNAMRDDHIRDEVMRIVAELHGKEYRIVLVHGGGPFIAETLAMAGIESTFIGGHRQTSAEALRYTEMALKGRVNGTLVSLLNKAGCKAVGLSGKDGRMAIAEKRYHQSPEGDAIDLGSVGDISSIDPTLLHMLLEAQYLPVLTCLAQGKDGADYNVNADMFAGAVAAALQADLFLILSDIDGVMMNQRDSSAILKKLSLSQGKQMMKDNVINGGMIPKIESCFLALENGVGTVRIINGTKPQQIVDSMNHKPIGTSIVLQI